MRPERLTLDSTATIDLLDEDQVRNPLALGLLDLAKVGRVELAVAASGHVHDQKGNAARRLRELERAGVLVTVQLAYPSVMYPGTNGFPGPAVAHFRAAWDAVLAETGALPRDRDALHVESHLLEERNVFITDDEWLLGACRRLAEKHRLPLVADSLGGYLGRVSTSPHTSLRSPA
jgi:hypothetical protein